MIPSNANLLSFLNDLRRGKIHYRFSQYRNNAIIVEVAVPGERWEVEFLDDGTVEAATDGPAPWRKVNRPP